MVAVASAEMEVAMVVYERGREDLPTRRSTSAHCRKPRTLPTAKCHSASEELHRILFIRLGCSVNSVDT